MHKFYKSVRVLFVVALNTLLTIDTKASNNPNYQHKMEVGLFVKELKWPVWRYWHRDPVMTFHFAMWLTWRVQSSWEMSTGEFNVRLLSETVHHTETGFVNTFATLSEWRGVIFSYANIISHCFSHITLWCSHLKLKREKRKWKYSGWSPCLLLQLGEGSLVVWHCCCSQSNQCTTNTTHSRNQWAQRSLGRIRGVVRKSLLPPCSYYVHGGQFTVFHAHKVRFTHEPDGSSQVNLKYCNCNTILCF